MVLRIPSPQNGFLGLSPSLTKAVVRALTALPSPHFRGSPQIKEHLDVLTTLFHQPSNPFRTFAISNRVRECLEEILVCANWREPERPQRFKQQMSEYIRAHLEETDADFHPRYAGRAVSAVFQGALQSRVGSAAR